MSEYQVQLWGVVFGAYIVPFALWALWRFSHGKRAENSVLIWTAGLFALFGLYRLAAPPGWGLIAGVLVQGGMAFVHARRWWRARDAAPPYTGP